MSDIERFGTILGIWAHPDDEAYLMGGLAGLAADRGQRVVCVTATAGEIGAGDPSMPPERLGPVRKAELAAALRMLGVHEHHWLDYPDGGCSAVDRDEAVRRLEAIVAQVRPDTLVTFGADGFTGHPDHVAVGAWAAAAVERSAPGVRVLVPARTRAWGQRFADIHELLSPFEPGLPVAVPDTELELELSLDEPTLDRKTEALLAQVSQTRPVVERIGHDAFRCWIDTESFAAPATVARHLRASSTPLASTSETRPRP